MNCGQGAFIPQCFNRLITGVVMVFCSPETVYRSMLTYDRAAAENYRKFVIRGEQSPVFDKYDFIRKILIKNPGITLKELHEILLKNDYITSLDSLRKNLGRMEYHGQILRKKTENLRRSYRYWAKDNKLPDTCN